MQNFFDKKKKGKLGKYMAKLTFLWYDNFGEEGPLQRNGMAAILKNCEMLQLEFGRFF